MFSKEVAQFSRGKELVEEGLALFASEDIDATVPVELGADIKVLSGLIDRLEVQRARRVELFDRDRGFNASGDTSTTNWLRRERHLSGFAAHRQVNFARQLPELEATQQALQAGEIGMEHALEIASATEDIGRRAEGELLEAARGKDPVGIRQAARELRHRVDAEGLAGEAMRQFEKRWLRVYDLPDGMLGLEGALPVEGGTKLRLCLESLRGVPPKDDERTPQQRGADALIELCTRQLDSGTLPRVGGRKPHLTLVMKMETLAGEPGAPAAQLEGAGPISTETARRLLCCGSASVLGVDEKGVALNLGRSKRLATEPQRRAMAVRHPRCVGPGCSWEARFCEPHHLDDWVLGGATDVERMVPLCIRHHHLVHEGGWTLREAGDGTFALNPPWHIARAG